MLFNSIEFLIFFPLVLLGFYIFPTRFRTCWLLLASYVFYMFWNPKYAVLILFSTVVTYFSGIMMEKYNSRQMVLALCIAANLLVLFVFKYADFMFGSIEHILNAVGVEVRTPRFDFLLPVGISFYSFQTIGYIIDVYKKTTKAEKNFVKYALFVSFFPQLVAGPIERSGHLLSEIDKICQKEFKSLSQHNLSSGVALIFFGLFQKMVIADRLAIFVDNIWNNLQMVGMVEGAVASVAFSFQIYCDFSAYSSIAIGCARLFSIELMENFNTPYFALSIKEFWRRWHISLSYWFRDYLYIPLGGSRCTKLKKYRNILLTFAVSGLWHGANWTYVFWGALHGLYQIIGDALRPVRVKLCTAFNIDSSTESNKFVQMLFTFCLTTFAWIFFRAPSLAMAKAFLKRIVLRPNPWALFDGSLYKFGIDSVDYHVLLFSLLILLVVSLLRHYKQEDFGQFMARQGFIIRSIVIFSLIYATIVYGSYGPDFQSSQFIYFQF